MSVERVWRGNGLISGQRPIAYTANKTISTVEDKAIDEAIRVRKEQIARDEQRANKMGIIVTCIWAGACLFLYYLGGW